MLELLIEVLGEIILQFSFEVLVEIGLRSLAAPFSRKPNPWLAALGYTIFGAAAGGLSLLVIPSHLVSLPSLRRVNLVVAPVMTGLLMCAIGIWRKRRGQELIRIDRFAYGFLFALSLALIRFAFAR